ncbi:E3 ubiquitin-protein ligase RHA2A-like [Zingiber officinale]|uniref:E3 ubiquitin-protein ligase RHA2A-like n=1 Tax=Zingiber officinale TaxID=94328 RepID=UPI001C4DA5E9|nr:E3 ubiquitin-protein ligase RHA2A-like [Zingiber officinale]
MGLSNRLHDAPGDSLPLLLLAAAASSIAYLRALLLRILPLSSSADPDDSADCDGSLGSGLAGLALLADHLAADRTFPFLLPRGDDLRPDCSVCLCRLADGDRVRRIPCGHVFHRDCLDGWLLQLNLSCPLCRYRLVAPELRAAADRRIGAELVACLSQS